MAGEYYYKNSDDTVRIRLMTRDSIGAETPNAHREWDADIFKKGQGCETYSKNGDVFYSKREGKAWLEKQFGKLFPLKTNYSVTEGWNG